MRKLLLLFLGPMLLRRLRIPLLIAPWVLGLILGRQAKRARRR